MLYVSKFTSVRTCTVLFMSASLAPNCKKISSTKKTFIAHPKLSISKSKNRFYEILITVGRRM